MVKRLTWLLAGLFITGGALAATTVKQEPNFEAGKRAYEASGYRNAILALQAAAAKEPQNGDGQLLLAKSYLELEEHDPAIKTAGRAVAIYPPNSVYHEWLCRGFGEKTDKVGMPSPKRSLAKETGKAF